jgi:hypothetical protein
VEAGSGEDASSCGEQAASRALADQLVGRANGGLDSMRMQDCLSVQSVPKFLRGGGRPCSSGRSGQRCGMGALMSPLRGRNARVFAEAGCELPHTCGVNDLSEGVCKVV